MASSIPADWWNSFSNNELSLILFVTEQCNFRCVYCYEDFKLGKIEADVISGIKNLIIERIEEIEVLNISFFGGEPLMNKDAIIDIASFSNELIKRKNLDTKFIGSITTNGYSLDIDTFLKFNQLGIVNYQITLDGDKELHDELRPTINGKSTFDKIFSNIVNIAKSSIHFNCAIRANVADYNLKSTYSLIDKISEIAKNDKRFLIHFHPIFGNEKLKLSADKIIDDLYKYTTAKGLKGDSEELKSYVCYAAKNNNFVIRANGIIQKCTVALDKEVNNIGRIGKGGELFLDEKKLKKWIFSKDKGCPLGTIDFENKINQLSV